MWICSFPMTAAGLLCEHLDHVEICYLCVIAEAPDVYPLGMMGFMIWDANSTDTGTPASRRAREL